MKNTWVTKTVGYVCEVGVGDMEKNIISRFVLEMSRFTILSRFFVMLVLLFCKLSEHYSQTNFPITKTKPFKVKQKKKKNGRYLGQSGWRIKIFVIILSFLLKNKNKDTHYKYT